jgi:hypothetical protein
MLNGILNVEMPLVHMICRYLPIKRVQQIITADKVVDEYGARAFGNMRNSNGNALNLFGQILAASESDEKSSLTDGDIRSEAGNLIVAGSDTTATTLTYLVWAVLKHPQLQTQLEEEIAQLSNELSMAEMEATPILNSVIEETLRFVSQCSYPGHDCGGVSYPRWDRSEHPSLHESSRSVDLLGAIFVSSPLRFLPANLNTLTASTVSVS